MTALRKTPDAFESVMDEIQHLCSGDIRRNESLKSWTTFHCSAIADAVVSPMGTKELSNILKALLEGGIIWKVIGRGSNVLVRDGGFRGVLIDLSEGFRKIEELKEENGKYFVRAESGVPNGTLLQWLRDRNVSGFGFSFGIPGSIGGGIRMNAGTPLGWFGDVVKEVEGVTSAGEVKRISVTASNFIYRDFPKGKDLIITSGSFEFATSTASKVTAEIEAAKSKRANQPLDLPNIGSVFKNPEGNFAGKLIEAAGLKGYRVGDAQISPKHANFIVNLGRATTKDTLAVMKHAQDVVRARFNVLLEPEVHVFGEDL